MESMPIANPELNRPMHGMSVGSLLPSVEHREFWGDEQSAIRGLAYDSRRVEAECLFCAIKGLRRDGHQFVGDALGRGATGVLSRKKPASESPWGYWIQVENDRLSMAQAAAAFHRFPGAELKLIGITGTNGKTTVLHLLASIIEAAGERIGRIGTLSYDTGTGPLNADRTTPEAIDLQALLAEMVRNRLTYCVMEVSSHALDLDRVVGCQFDVGVFTNLSKDHFDYHASYEHYFQAKAKLFDFLKEGGAAVVNADDQYGQRLIQSESKRCFSFGLRGGTAEISPIRFQSDLAGLDIAMQVGREKLTVHVPLSGTFNLYNVLAASAAAHALGVPTDAIRSGLEAIEPVPGRVERLDVETPYRIYIDYAHTPGALQELLALFREESPGRVILVFGCGGERDKEKRPEMGRIAAQGSHIPIVTSDNPRSEDPEAIVEAVLAGLKPALASGQPYYAIVDRREAIEQALQIAEPDDVVLIAGKGHEAYQILGKERLSFHDGEVVKEILEKAGG